MRKTASTDFLAKEEAYYPLQTYRSIIVCRKTQVHSTDAAIIASSFLTWRTELQCISKFHINQCVHDILCYRYRECKNPVITHEAMLLKKSYFLYFHAYYADNFL